MTERETAPGTRARLLAAAVRLFAEQGLAGTSVRQLAEAAGANVAAVSYHFGSKDALYAEALRGAFLPVRDALPRFLGILEAARSSGTPAAAATGIRAFVQELVDAMIPADEPNAYARLLTRELTDPSPALDPIVRDFVAPRNEVLVALLRQARPDLGPQQLLLYANSIFGQGVFYQLALPVVLRLLGRERMTPELREEIGEHIADFSLRALGVREE